jgi:hypothetical protein
MCDGLAPSAIPHADLARARRDGLADEAVDADGREEQRDPCEEGEQRRAEPLAREGPCRALRHRRHVEHGEVGRERLDLAPHGGRDRGGIAVRLHEDRGPRETGLQRRIVEVEDAAVGPACRRGRLRPRRRPPRSRPPRSRRRSRRCGGRSDPARATVSAPWIR